MQHYIVQHYILFGIVASAVLLAIVFALVPLSDRWNRRLAKIDSTGDSREDRLMTRQTVNFIAALLDGVTGAGLFGRIRYPGAPIYAVDPRSADEILEAMPSMRWELAWQRQNQPPSPYKRRAKRSARVEEKEHHYH